jgi:ABC-type antimicrobial peptide transport system permease subunit
VKLYDMVELAGRNLREAGLRNSLTTLGIGVGVASLVAMLSLGIGLQLLFKRELGRSSLFDSVYVTSRQDFRPRRVGDNRPTRSLDDGARKSFEKLPGVLEVYPNFAAVGEFRFDDSKITDSQSHFSVVTGLPSSARNSEAFDDIQGHFFSGPQAAEAVLMGDFARELLGLPEEQDSDKKLTSEQANRLLGQTLILRYAEREAQASPPDNGPATAPTTDSALGDNLAFNVVRKEQALKIVGIVVQEPVRGIPRTGRSSVFLPIAFAESLNMIQPGDLRNVVRPAEGKTYLALIVRVEKSKDVAPVEEEIKKQGFGAFSLLDASRNVRIVFVFLDLFLGIFGSLALVVASLGIVNTLVMAILERRREIGIMKALGASDGDVKQIFFVEACTMGVLGGALGVGLGWLIGRVINFGTNIYLQRQLEAKPQDFWYVPLWLVLGAVGFSVVVSWFAGLYPASRAAKLDPVQALRHE